MSALLCCSKTLGRICLIGLVVAAPSILGGCATKDAFVAQSTKANLSLEEAHNQILLLNVMRATFRRPMYFSTITEFNGPIGQGFVSGSLGLAFQPYDAAPNIVPTIQYTPDRTSFKVAPLDNQEFIAGFTAPIRLATFDYFWQQRWPPELLLALIVDHVSVFKIERKDGKLARTKRIHLFENYPGDKQKYTKFVELIHELANEDCRLRVDNTPAHDEVEGPPLGTEQLLKLDQRMLVAKEGFRLVELKSEAGKGLAIYALESTRKSATLAIEPTCLSPSTDNHHLSREPGQQSKTIESLQERPSGAKAKNVTISAITMRGPNVPYTGLSSAKISDKQIDCTGECVELEISFRSPQSIVYYLGELARVSLFGTEPCISSIKTDDLNCEKYAPTIKIKGVEYELFPIATDNVPARAAGTVGVDFLGEYYFIRSLAAKPDRSMQALSLVSLLIGLQKKASDLPTSSSVRVIGQ